MTIEPGYLITNHNNIFITQRIINNENGFERVFTDLDQELNYNSLLFVVSCVRRHDFSVKPILCVISSSNQFGWIFSTNYDIVCDNDHRTW